MVKKAIAVTVMAPAVLIGLAMPAFAEADDSGYYHKPDKEYAQEKVPPKTHPPAQPLPKTGADNTPMMLGLAGGLVLLGGATYAASKVRRNGERNSEEALV
jgi:LPXTG-motif cell wall-anchored protein